MSERMQRMQRGLVSRRHDWAKRGLQSLLRLGIAISVALALVASFFPAVASGQSTPTPPTTTTEPPPPVTEPPPPVTEPPPPVTDPTPTTTTEPTTTGPPTTAPSTTTPGPSTNVQDNLLLLQQQQKQRLAQLQVEADVLAKGMAAARQVLDELDLGVENANDLIEEVLRKLEAHRRKVRQRAIAAYKGDTSYLSVLLDAKSPIDFLSRAKFLSEANSADKDRIELLKEQKAALEAQQGQMAGLRKTQRQKVAEMERSQRELGAKLNQMVTVLSALPSQQTIAYKGFTFPVSAPFTYSDDFGDHRSGPPPHPHAGNDIFCVPGAPLLATESGVIANRSDRGLGGSSLWLVGDSGTGYYYAHLSAYYPGVDNGVRVSAGQYVGFCGNTGNARTTPHHLHFEIHPGGRGLPAINPYPILKATEQAMIATLGAQLGKTSPGTPPPGSTSPVAPVTTTLPPTPDVGTSAVGVSPGSPAAAPQAVVPPPTTQPIQPPKRVPPKASVFVY